MGVTETWFTLLTIFAGKSCGQYNWPFGDYDVRRPFLTKVLATELNGFVPSSVYMAHPTPLPAWCECRVWLSWCGACGLPNPYVIHFAIFLEPRKQPITNKTFQGKIHVLHDSRWFIAPSNLGNPFVIPKKQWQTDNIYYPDFLDAQLFWRDIKYHAYRLSKISLLTNTWTNIR